MDMEKKKVIRSIMNLVTQKFYAMMNVLKLLFVCGRLLAAWTPGHNDCDNDAELYPDEATY